MSSRPRLVDAALSIVLGVVVLGPLLLHRGFALRGDMVFVPTQPWKDAWLGLDGRVPRFVPGDAFVSVASHVFPGDLLQRAVLLGALVVGGIGAGLLVGRHRPLARAAAITLFLWNPWVFERLTIGQWGVVVGYLLLPWMVRAAAVMRDDLRAGLPAVCAWLGAAAIFSPPSGLIAFGTVLAVVLARPRWGTALASVLAAVLVNLPWIVPSLVQVGGMDVPAGQFAGFAARGESSLGVVASALSLGGIWKASVVPGERTLPVIVLLAGALTVVALAGLRRAVTEDRRLVIGLAVASGTSLAIALVPTLPVAARLLQQASESVVALGLLRDSHRFLGSAVLVLLPGVAAVVDWVVERARPGREALVALAVVVVVWPVLCLPSMALGLGGELSPESYPREWETVRRLMPEGRTVVLPWRGGYRGFDWNQHRAVLDPAPRYFPGDVLIDDRLFLGDRVIASEDPLLSAVGRAVRSEDPAEGLRRLGVRLVLFEKDNGGRPPDYAGATVLHNGSELLLLDLGPVRPPASPITHRSMVLVSDGVALVVWVGGVFLACRRLGRRNV